MNTGWKKFILCVHIHPHIHTRARARMHTVKFDLYIIIYKDLYIIIYKGLYILYKLFQISNF